MLQNTRKLRIMGSTALLALVLAACGSAATGSPATGSTLPTSTQSGAAAATAQTGSPAATATAKLNLNAVTEDQLLSTIPNFNSRMVREFMEYRPYISILQFRKEIGKYVSAEQVAAYEQYVYVPIDVDQADTATLQQLPGVDTTIADALIAGRPYGSNQAFLAKLAGSVSVANVKQAETYLTTK
jgi:DNA uptake protein ComE-like DNA-binding protein